MAASLHLLGQFDDAIDALRHTLSLAGRTSRGHRNLGVVLSQAGRFDEAVSEFDRALALDPDDAHTRADLACTRYWQLVDPGGVGRVGVRARERPARHGYSMSACPVGRSTIATLGFLVLAEQGVGDELMFT